MDKKGFLYIIKSPNCKRPYLGSSSNLENRVAEHNKGTTRATKNKGPWSLFWFNEFSTIEEARKLESLVKKRKIKISPEKVEKIIKRNSSDG